MIQQGQTEAKQAPITAIRAMNGFYPVVSHSNAAQVDDPQVSQASGDHQIAQALRIRQVTFVQEEPTAFFVGEERFDLKTLFVPVKGFIGQFEIGHQIDGMSKPPFPPEQSR